MTEKKAEAEEAVAKIEDSDVPKEEKAIVELQKSIAEYRRTTIKKITRDLI